MGEELMTEFRTLSEQGGWLFWGLVALAFGIASGLVGVALSIWKEPDAPVDFEREKRRIDFCFVMIGAAPLIGLLGTVVGMLATFSGLAGSSGGTPMDTISRGISQALITTQTGLVIAVPTFVVATILNLRLRNVRILAASNAPNGTSQK